MIKRVLSLALCSLLCILSVACNQGKDEQPEGSGLETTPDGTVIYTDSDGNQYNVTFDDGQEQATELALPEVEFPQEAARGTYEDTPDATVTLQGDTATVDGVGVSIDGSTITFTSQGTYLLCGNLNGQLVVDTPGPEKVKLILDGVSVSCESGPALQVNTAQKKVVLYSTEGSVNLFSDGSDYYVEAEDGSTGGCPNACIWSAEDLKFAGNGSIYITGNCDKGINTKDDLEIKSGNIYVRSKGVGMRGNDSVSILGGYVHVSSTEGDGIKTSNTEQGKGLLSVSSGEIYIDCFGDGLSAATDLYVSGGKLAIRCEGTVTEAATDSSYNPAWGGMGGHGGRPGGMDEGNPNKSSTSAKGLKAAGAVYITGGHVTVACTDDAIHADSTVQIDHGNLYLRAGDDGIHADKLLLINGGVIEIAESYEGVEAVEITVNGGTVRLNSSDDGFNACGGVSMMGGGFGRPGQAADTSATGTEETPLLTFNGGYTVVNASGDGIDSNGCIIMTGGTVIVYGPVDNGNGPIDHGDARTDLLTVSGGTLLAIGSSGMADTAVGDGRAVIAFMTRASFGAGTDMAILDSEGNVVFAFESPKAFASVVLSTGDLVAGKSYTVVYDGTLSGGNEQDGIWQDVQITEYTELGSIQAE